MTTEVPSPLQLIYYFRLLFYHSSLRSVVQNLNLVCPEGLPLQSLLGIPKTEFVDNEATRVKIRGNRRETRKGSAKISLLSKSIVDIRLLRVYTYTLDHKREECKSEYLGQWNKIRNLSSLFRVRVLQVCARVVKRIF